MKQRKTLLTIYLILISTILPVFMKDGYFKLGEIKGIVYMIISAVMALIIAFTYRPDFLEENNSQDDIANPIKIFVYINIINFIFALDKEVSFFGIEGWRTGLATMLLMLFYCYAFSGGFFINGYTLAAIFITPFVIGIFVTMERFGINLINIVGTDSAFVASIGNINWYAGYLSIFAPIGIGFAATRKTFSKGFFLWSIYSISMLISLFTQGSESALLILIGTYGLLIWYCLYTAERMKHLMIQIFILGLSMMAVKNLLICFPGAYTYTDNILIKGCDMYIGAGIMGAAAFVYILIKIFEKFKPEKWNGVSYRKRYVVLFFVMTVAAGVFAAMNIDSITGNGRDTIWITAFDMFDKLPSFRKVVGVGRDCFSSYAYSDRKWTETLVNVFGDNKLTNAHNIFLTELIEGGLSGLLGALSVVIYVLYTLKKSENKKEHAAVICALPIVSYCLNGLVSFSQILSTPYFYICLGLGLYVAKGSDDQISGTGIDSSSS